MSTSLPHQKAKGVESSPRSRSLKQRPLQFMNGKKPAVIWEYFVKVEDSSDGQCTSCGASVRRTGGTTTIMINHLKRFHRDLFQEYKVAQNQAKYGHGGNMGAKGISELGIRIGKPGNMLEDENGDSDKLEVSNKLGRGVDTSVANKIDEINKELNWEMTSENSIIVNKVDRDVTYKPLEKVSTKVVLEEKNLKTEIDKDELHKNKTKLASPIWLFFSKDDDNADIAICTYCNKQVGRPKGTTSGMMVHLQGRHKSVYKKVKRYTNEKKKKISEESVNVQEDLEDDEPKLVIDENEEDSTSFNDLKNDVVHQPAYSINQYKVIDDFQPSNSDKSVDLEQDFNTDQNQSGDNLQSVFKQYNDLSKSIKEVQDIILDDSMKNEEAPEEEMTVENITFESGNQLYQDPLILNFFEFEKQKGVAICNFCGHSIEHPSSSNMVDHLKEKGHGVAFEQYLKMKRDQNLESEKLKEHNEVSEQNVSIKVSIGEETVESKENSLFNKQIRNDLKEFSNQEILKEEEIAKLWDTWNEVNEKLVALEREKNDIMTKISGSNQELIDIKTKVTFSQFIGGNNTGRENQKRKRESNFYL